MLENPTVQQNAFCNSWAKIACCSSVSKITFTSKMPASNSSPFLPFFCKLHSSSNPTNKTLTELVMEIQTAQSPQLFKIWHMFINCFLTMINIITSQNSDLSSWTTLYSDYVMGGEVFDTIFKKYLCYPMTATLLKMQFFKLIIQNIVKWWWMKIILTKNSRLCLACGCFYEDAVVYWCGGHTCSISIQTRVFFCSFFKAVIKVR
jgi:hypothetical protein